jgi:hypothetical protein
MYVHWDAVYVVNDSGHGHTPKERILNKLKYLHEKTDREIIFSMVVVMLLALAVLQYKKSQEDQDNYAHLHELSTDVLNGSKECIEMRDGLIVDFTSCSNQNDTLRLALKNTNELYGNALVKNAELCIIKRVS